MIRNLGQVAAIYIGSSAPRNTNLIWLDNTVVPFVFRAYDGSAWSEIATHKWVRAYVDGWLVTLPPRQLADDGDYMLINSNNVNYKITVKDFVKSAVGNPLDFKGVIRVSADFPNPSTLESGDMYVIITSPAGGTVTDPYSGKTFEDSEKIVWDEVTQSWESLGKIDITVDLTTSYSETEVTIHSSAGKETTIQGATDQLAGVMLPGQYSWLQALSNGSIVPGDPSPLTPLTPAHKHNYNDIINRLVSQQGTGESTVDPMSQKATTDALNLKFDKASVLQVSGAATDKVMSQKAVTDALKTLSDDFNNKLTNYLPLSGGRMAGDISFPSSYGIVGRTPAGDVGYHILRVLGTAQNPYVAIGTDYLPTYISSAASDLLHDRNGSLYKIWDSYNLSKPTVYNGGTIGTPTTIYDRNLSVNGTGWTFLSATNAVTTSIFAPTTVGIQGYYLVSSGTGAPVWQQLEDLGDGKYLPLIGGTLTGQVTIQQNVDIKLRLQSTDADNYCIIQAINAQASQLGVFGYAGDKWAIGHGGTYYEIWDKYNLSDPATKSGNNTFTGNNTFQVGKFNVGSFGVTSGGSLLSNISTPAGSSWARNLTFEANSDATSKSIFGGYNSVDNTNLGYAYIGIGDVNFSTAQYKFRPASLEVPIAWSLDDPNGNALVWSQSLTLAHLGRATGTTKIRSGAVDLIHTKGTTDYKILDESNWESIIPNVKWTYGFVTITPFANKVDFNTVFAGPDSPKILFGYDHQLGGDTNAPSGMKHGAVLQIDGNYNSSYNNIALRPQLAFDINHNVENGTRYMWFRTANNLGYGDSSNWKRVVTADENVVAFITANGYPTVGRLDGSDIGWLRTPANGLLPTSPVSLNDGGNSSLGNSSWSFSSASIANVYTNKISFGTNGAFIDNQSGDSSHIGIGFYTSQSAGCPVYVGSLCVSDDYANSAPNIPANGIYSKGIIYIENGIGFRNSIWTNDLTPNRNYSGYLQVLDAYDAANAGGPTNHGTVLQINSRINHWANQLWFGNNDNMYLRRMNYGPTTYGEWNRLLTNKDVNIIPTQSTSNPTTLPVNQIFYSEIQRVAGTPTVQGALFSVQGDDEGIQLWASSSRNELYYRTKWASYGNWIKLAATSDLNSYLTKTEASTLYYPYNGRGYLSITSTGRPVMSNNQGYAVKDKDGNEREVLWMGTSNILNLGNTSHYTLDQLDLRCTTLTHNGNSIATQNYITNQLANYLPLSGGTITSSGLNPVYINSTSDQQSALIFHINSSLSAAVGGNKILGAFLQDGSGAILTVKSDGAYYGVNTSSPRKLATVTDLAGYLPLSGGTMSGNISFNGDTGHIVVGARETSNYVSSITYTKGSTSNAASMGYHSTGGSDSSGALVLVPYPTSADLWSKTVGLYIAKNELLLDGKAIATQEWINSQNFVKSTSTKKVTDIQPVDALPATQASGVLYLVFG